GVLVLQRRATAFSADEITLATALGAPVTLAIERRRAAEVRSARLHGLAHVGGSVRGRATVVATSTALAHAPLHIDHPMPRPRDDRAARCRRPAGARRGLARGPRGGPRARPLPPRAVRPGAARGAPRGRR